MKVVGRILAIPAPMVRRLTCRLGERLAASRSTRSSRWFAPGGAIAMLAVVVGGASVATGSDTSSGLSAWFETVAEAERMAQQAAPGHPGPGGDGDQQNPPGSPPASPGGQPPQPPAPAGAADTNTKLGELIGRRNDLVTKTKLFTLLRKMATRKKLSKPERDALARALRDWFRLYFQMRAFQPNSRRDPNLPEVRRTFDEAVQARGDFVEGRILAAICHLYGGDDDRARKLLLEASGFLTAHALNVSPLGQDCCAHWLALGQPEAVEGYVNVLKDEKTFPRRLRTPMQAVLVAVHGWQADRPTWAREYFEEALQKARVWNGGGAAAAGLVAEAATFYLLAGTRPPRDPARGEQLLGQLVDMPPEKVTWPLRRARAALAAASAGRKEEAGEQAAADTLWAEAVQELEACRRDCLPTLDGEIDAQLKAYRGRAPWYRERRQEAAEAED